MYRCLYRGMGDTGDPGFCVSLSVSRCGGRCLYRGVGVLFGEVNLGTLVFCVSLSVSGCGGPIY